MVLVGASFGGLIAQIEAYSFADIDGLVVMSWADEGFSPLAVLTFTQTVTGCVAGLASLGSGGYAYFGQTEADYRHAFFYSADPATERRIATRPRDPCGEEGSFAQGVLVDHLDVPRIHVPVLLMDGDRDALFLRRRPPNRPPSTPAQAR